MNNKSLLMVALRYNAMYLNIKKEDIDMTSSITPAVYSFTERMKENGFCLSEELLHALCKVEVGKLADMVAIIKEETGINLNWTPLVKGWDVPTGESKADHFITWIANLFGKDAKVKGTQLPCGHLIPEGTFPLERYNGCPYCGKSFNLSGEVFKGQGTKLKELRLFTEEDMKGIFSSLLSSPTPLDATAKDSLKMLLAIYELPEGIEIGMKETIMLVIHQFIEKGEGESIMRYIKTPTDIMRYLWYEKTGYVQIFEPSVLERNARRLDRHICPILDESLSYEERMKASLKLKYNRKMCKIVSSWMNNLPISATAAAENMNAKRGMWVRFIRALRMAEYAKRKGFEHLAEILDVFYNQTYSTWQGNVDKTRMANDPNKVLSLLQKRPGGFVRCMFATMLRFGADETLEAFDQIADMLPARLLISLGNAAEIYFDRREVRSVSTITGSKKVIGKNKLLALYSEDERRRMVEKVEDIYKNSMYRRFKAQVAECKSIYIAPELFDIPVSVGDRTTTIQDSSMALMGTKFHVEGDSVRLFLQWGKGLHAQHLDMDLSCRITYLDEKTEECAYYNLTCTGAKHSGDIREIPEMVGTAEYVELSLPELEKAGAVYVVFTCNAYSCGSLSPNLMVGWMNSENEMKISEKSGVAYDPSCVQHMVRVADNNLSKGLVFGVLDLKKREIIWLELPFMGLTLRSLSTLSIDALLQRLKKKLKLGELLKMKAEAQGLEIVEDASLADEVYSYEWALNPTKVNKLLF